MIFEGLLLSQFTINIDNNLFDARITIFLLQLTKKTFCANISVKILFNNLLQRKWLTNANECFKRATEMSLGIANCTVNIRNENVFINGIRFAN